MRTLLMLTAATLLTTASTNVSFAEKVVVSDVHMCCGACVRDANKALDAVKGIADVEIDRKAKTVTFSASTDDLAKAGYNALLKAGFYGKGVYNEKSLANADKIEEGTVADTVTLTGVHLCCGACVKDAEKSVKGLDGVTTVEVDRKAKTVTLKGEKINVLEAVKALKKSGFNANVKS